MGKKSCVRAIWLALAVHCPWLVAWGCGDSSEPAAVHQPDGGSDGRIDRTDELDVRGSDGFGRADSTIFPEGSLDGPNEATSDVELDSTPDVAVDGPEDGPNAMPDADATDVAESGFSDATYDVANDANSDASSTLLLSVSILNSSASIVVYNNATAQSTNLLCVDDSLPGPTVCAWQVPAGAQVDILSQSPGMTFGPTWSGASCTYYGGVIPEVICLILSLNQDAFVAISWTQ